MNEVIQRMRQRLNELAVNCLCRLEPRSQLAARRYAVGYFLCKIRMMWKGQDKDATSWPVGWMKEMLENQRCLGRAIKTLNEFKKNHPEVINEKAKQLTLAL